MLGMITVPPRLGSAWNLIGATRGRVVIHQGYILRDSSFNANENGLWYILADPNSWETIFETPTLDSQGCFGFLADEPSRLDPSGFLPNSLRASATRIHCHNLALVEHSLGTSSSIDRFSSGWRAILSSEHLGDIRLNTRGNCFLNALEHELRSSRWLLLSNSSWIPYRMTFVW